MLRAMRRTTTSYRSEMLSNRGLASLISSMRRMDCLSAGMAELK